MCKYKYAMFAILALLIGGLIANQSYAGPKDEEVGVGTWYHSPSTGTGFALPANEAAVIYGVSFSTLPAITVPLFINFFSTNSATGNPRTATRVWEVAITSRATSNDILWITPPAPIRPIRCSAELFECA